MTLVAIKCRHRSSSWFDLVRPGPNYWCSELVPGQLINWSWSICGWTILSQLMMLLYH